ncbi:MAG: hypothetical protein L0H84_04720, partial [Pseudonocardia sp.]|nr:hypothetical protein [Pseudonocardia sp.]
MTAAPEPAAATATAVDLAAEPSTVVDLATTSVRELNAELHAPGKRHYDVLAPHGAHAVAAGIDTDMCVLKVAMDAF